MTTSEHPPPEDLSAFLDGEAPAAAAHVEGCARCQAELSRLRSVSGALAQPVAPPPPSVVDAAVARALEATEDVGRAGGRERPAVPLRRRSRAFVVGVASGSVAAVLLAVLAALAVVDRGGDETAVDTALAPARESAVQDRAAAGAGAPPPVALAAGEDLGEVGDPAALAGRLAGRIPGPEAAAGPLAVPPAGVRPVGEAALPPAGGQAPCEPQARLARPGLGPLVYAAGGTRQGRPVVVVGFGPPAGADGISLLVLARDGCELVYATSTS